MGNHFHLLNRRRIQGKLLSLCRNHICGRQSAGYFCQIWKKNYPGALAYKNEAKKMKNNLTSLLIIVPLADTHECLNWQQGKRCEVWRSCTEMNHQRQSARRTPELENKRKPSIVYTFFSQRPLLDVFREQAFSRFQRWRGLLDAVLLFWLQVSECSQWAMSHFPFFKTRLSDSDFLQSQKMTSFGNSFFWVTIKLRWGHLFSL